MDNSNDHQIIDNFDDLDQDQSATDAANQFAFYGKERDDVDSEIPPNLKYFIKDVARPSTQITQPVDYATEEEAERIIEQIDLMVKT